MLDLMTRPQPLRELSDLLAIPSPPPSYIPVKKREVTKVEVHPGCYKNYAQERCADSVNDKFELVMPLNTDIGMLFKFMVNVEKKISDFDGQVTILKHRRSSNPGFITTVEIRGARLSNIINNLANMSEVEKVEAEPLAIANLPRFSSKPVSPPTSTANHIKRIYLSLKESSVTTQREPVAAFALA